MNIKEVLEDIKRHLDYVNATNRISIRDNQMKVMYEEIERLNNIINELEKWIDEYYKNNRKWYNTELSSHDKRYYEREYINIEAMLVKFDKQLKELKGADKE